jgi:hypothetical protein
MNKRRRPAQNLKPESKFEHQLQHGNAAWNERGATLGWRQFHQANTGLFLTSAKANMRKGARNPNPAQHADGEIGSNGAREESNSMTQTTAQVLQQQRDDANAVVPLKPATPANINDGLGYLSEDASSGTVLRFSKDGKFILPTEGDAELAEGTELVCHWSQARGGFQKFNGAGKPPDTRIDRIFGGTPPKREDLDERDPSQWPESALTGRPEDPWRKVVMVPLEDPLTAVVYVFSTMSKTGRRAVSNLLTQAAKMMAATPGELPVVRLRCGGYDDKRFGWVRVPAFEFRGRAPATNIAAADTSIAADLNDEVPF